MSFAYLLERIESAPFEVHPFRHIHLRDFFSQEHFEAISSAPEIELPQAECDERLFESLFLQNYRIINFSGCVTDRNAYIEWHKNKSRANKNISSLCEGFGMTLRLTKPVSPIVRDVFDFMAAPLFKETIARKFGLERSELTYDSGIQKYLDGYEISPHPDVRGKALTYLVNINPGANAEKRNHHTKYLRFRKDYEFVYKRWSEHPEEDRGWVPWKWCETVSEQSNNNSMVIFAPGNDTLHAVRADYEHLHFQRTQMYGNLWYRGVRCKSSPTWTDYELRREPVKPHMRRALAQNVKRMIPPPIKSFIKRTVLHRGDDKVIYDRIHGK